MDFIIDNDMILALSVFFIGLIITIIWGYLENNHEVLQAILESKYSKWGIIIVSLLFCIFFFQWIVALITNIAPIVALIVFLLFIGIGLMIFAFFYQDILMQRMYQRLEAREADKNIPKKDLFSDA